jgi:hypothetical protein
MYLWSAIEPCNNVVIGVGIVVSIEGIADKQQAATVPQATLVLFILV